MRLSLLILPLTTTLLPLASAAITWTLVNRNATPTPDETDAYARITDAITTALARWAPHHPRITKALRVSYAPGVPTAEANYNGDVRFGSNRAYMNERTALHEISHTLGIGQTAAFFDRCDRSDWPAATRFLQSVDGADARLNCGGGHVWPYGLNYDSEFSETNAERHVQLIVAMLEDGM
ncbi:hypothetical protein CERZMDRAFT_89133 [Cercospora zeae-maydis SCOH1-5]|uniref:Ricin B lectin n=1 Tax=Cercospora zeae-maydis SCOH1-5 TaxID=717836 RepID=A0A6A6F0C3_9PEZI|nr:hypothetical protein CERZMDRAFT_89133 [Cercospora zeae-maydis SCOH1-5]